MREIILDTETTGFKSSGDDRIIEIACLEMVNKKLTNTTFQVYLNPERDVPLEATKVHNITTDFLKDKPLFSDVVNHFLDFIEDSPLIIHNAPFDMGFLNAELRRVQKQAIDRQRAICTLAMAREKFPGSNNTLDGLCKRFKIDLKERLFHGALIDCALLAKVYVELMGGRQKIFDFKEKEELSQKNMHSETVTKNYRRFEIPEHDRKAHDAFIESLQDPLWKKVI